MASNRVLIVSIGRGGNAVASAFLDRLLRECGVGPNGEPPSDPGLASALEVFCDRTGSGHLVPRRLMAAARREDLPPRQGAHRAAYPEDSYFLATEIKEAHNWAAAYKAKSMEGLIERTQNIVTLFDNTCAIWCFHAIGGGFGSGVGSSYLWACANEIGFNDGIIVSLPITPDGRLYDNALAAYNATFALKDICESCHQTVVISNTAAYQAARRSVAAPDVSHLNPIIAEALCTLVSPLLWPDADGMRLSVRGLHAALWTPREGVDWAWRQPDHERSNTLATSEILVSLSLAHPANAADGGGADLAASLLAGDAKLLSSDKAGTWLRMFAVYSGRAEGSAGFAGGIPGGRAQLALNPNAGQARAIAGGMNAALLETLVDIQRSVLQLFRRKFSITSFTKYGVGEDELQNAIESLDFTITELTTEQQRFTEAPETEE